MTSKRAQKKETPKTVKVGRGRPPAGDVERYRERILDATAGVFLEMGFERGSTNEIARRAQTSKQTLYSLYPSKADLFLAVMKEHTEQLYSKHAYYIESEKAPRAALGDIGERILLMLSAPEYLALNRVAVTEVHKFPELARMVWRDCAERGYELLAEYLKSRRIGGPDYRASAELFCVLVLRDFLSKALLHPKLELSEREVRERAKQAVNQFFRLHPIAAAKKGGKHVSGD